MSDVPLWNCEFIPLKQEGGPALESLTVGSPFGWKCHGDLPITWVENAPPHLVFAKPEDQYSLQILKIVRQDANDVQYVVTGYKAGNHAPEFVRVMQSQNGQDKGFEVGGAKWQIASVLDNQKQQPQPYPPYGPWTFSLPLWFIVTLAAVGLLLLYLLVRFVRRTLQRRKMLEELKLHQTALPPLHQFYRDARNLRRRLNDAKAPEDFKAVSSDLDRDFRLYVLRKFQIPTLVWSDRAVLEDLRRRHRPVYQAAGDLLKRTLRELTKLKGRASVELKDLEQLHRMSLDAAERLEQGGHP
jgi:hypothetical protein